MVQFDGSSIHDRLSHIRLRYKLTQKEFAYLIDVSHISICRWEHDIIPHLTIKSYTKLIRLGLNPMYIINNESFFYENNNDITVGKNIYNALKEKREG